VNLYSKCTRSLTFENISLQDTGATQTQMERPRRNNPHLMFVGEFAPTYMERPADTWQASLNVCGSPHVRGQVRTNRRRNRRGCGQTWGEHRPMLTCSGCRVARFCSADHQKMASKKAAFGRSLTTGRHEDICGLFKKWRKVVKDRVAPDPCTADLVAFLQRCPKTQR
jgi:hypothetical protein